MRSRIGRIRCWRRSLVALAPAPGGVGEGASQLRAAQGLQRSGHARQVRQGRRAQGRLEEGPERAGPEPGHLGERRLLRAAGEGRRQADQGLAGVGGRAAREPARGPLGAQQGEGRGRPRRSRLFDYYLGCITDPSITNHFQLIPDADVGVRARVGDERRDRGPPPGGQGGASSWAARWSSAVTRSAARSPPRTRPGTSTASPAPRTSPGSCSSTAAAARPRSRRRGDPASLQTL